MKFDAIQSRHLIDTYLSLQWCRENFVVPLGSTPEGESASTYSKHQAATGEKFLVIAIGDLSYLATIGDFIQKRLSGFTLQFTELQPKDIEGMLESISKILVGRIPVEINDIKGFHASVEMFFKRLARY